MSENVTFMLANTASASQVFLDKEMSELGLTRSQWMMLAHLYFMEGCNQKELADLLDIGKGAAGKLAIKLEQKGWVLREETSGDGRAVTLRLKKDVRPLVQLLVELLFEETRRSLADLTADELNTLRHLVQRVHYNVEHQPTSTKWRKIKQRLLEQADAIGATAPPVEQAPRPRPQRSIEE